MKMKSFYYLSSLFVAAAMFTGCSENEVNPDETGDTGNLKMEFTFTDDSPVSRAVTSGVPLTNWSKVSQVQFFLYDSDGTIQWSAVETPSGSSWASGAKELNYAQIKAGTYTLVAVANANDGSLVNYNMGLTQAAETWDASNVRQKDIDNMYLTNAVGAYPSFMTVANTKDKDGNSLLDASIGNKFYKEPADIFMGEALTAATGGSATTVTISSSSTPKVYVKLTREISMMRVRVNNQLLIDDSKFDADFAKDASILIYKLPNYMQIHAGTAKGGVSSASTATSILSVYDGVDGSNTFNSNPPTLTDYSGTTGFISTATGFNYWRDIKVFPNNGGRTKNATTTETTESDEKFVIVISARGAVGHTLANGDVLTTAKPVYWTGSIPHAFNPNTIREVNLTITNGGTSTPPAETPEYGDLDVSVQLVPWGTVWATDIDV